MGPDDGGCGCCCGDDGGGGDGCDDDCALDLGGCTVDGMRAGCSVVVVVVARMDLSYCCSNAAAVAADRVRLQVKELGDADHCE